MKISPASVEKVTRKVFPEARIKSMYQVGDGHVNDIYCLNISKPTRSLVLRVSPQGRYINKFEKEEMVYGLLRESTTLPLAEIYIIDRNTMMSPCMLMSRLPGRPMSRIYPEAEPEAKEALIEKAGEVLGEMHTVRVDYVRGSQGDVYTDWGFWFRKNANENIGRNAKLKILPPDLRKRVVKTIRKGKTLLKDMNEFTVLHNDFHMSNLLTDGESITGVLDFEWAMFGHYAYDFVKLYWDVFDSPGKKDAFLKGYKKYSEVSDNLDMTIAYYSIHRALPIMRFFHNKEEEDKVEMMRKTIETDIERFNKLKGPRLKR